MRRKWTKYETEFLLNNYKKLSAHEFAIKLNRTRTSIFSKLFDYKLTPRNSKKMFSKEDVDYIINNYNKVSVLDMSKFLNRPATTVRVKLKQMNLVGISTLINWNDEKLNELKKHSGKNYGEIAKILNCSRRMVELKMKEIGLNKFKNDHNSKEIICTNCKNKFPKTSEFFYFTKKDRTKLSCSVCISCSKRKNKLHVSSLDNYLKMLLRGVLGDPNRTNKNNINSNIDFEFLKNLYLNQNGKCAITNIVMEYSQLGGRNMKNISIDRINNFGGYTKDNIQLVCRWANISRNELSMSDYKVYILKSYNNLILKQNNLLCQ